jgi:hypothetical protein
MDRLVVARHDPLIQRGSNDRDDGRMLESVMGGPRTGVSLLAHHDPEWREYAYGASPRKESEAEVLDLAQPGQNSLYKIEPAADRAVRHLHRRAACSRIPKQKN